MTPRERDTLAAIAHAIDGRGRSPTVRELQDAIGVTSSSQVADTLDRLEARELIARLPPGRHRNVRLTDAGRRALGHADLADAARAVAAQASPHPGGGYVVPPAAFEKLTQAIGASDHG